MTGFKHGFARPECRSPAYRSWESARARCNNPNNPDYAGYGGRGIRVCERWNDFTTFLSDMGERPRGHTLDRIDVNGNYEPGNCRWATHSDQSLNRRCIRRYKFEGRALTIAELSRDTGIPYQRLHERIVRRGWGVDRAVFEPARGW